MPKPKQWAGREGARCRRGQGALTSPARHSRGSRLHVPRASPARSTSLRRARTRAPVSRVRFFVPAHARPHFDGSDSRPSSGQSTSAPCLAPPPRNLVRTAPLSAHVVWASSPGQLASSGFLGCGFLYVRRLGRVLSASCVRPRCGYPFRDSFSGPPEAQPFAGGAAGAAFRPLPVGRFSW